MSDQRPQRGARDLIFELQKTATTLRDAAILLMLPAGKHVVTQYVVADHSDTFAGWQRALDQLNDHMESGGVPIGIVGVSSDGLIMTRPFEEYADNVDVGKTLAEAATQLAEGRHTPKLS
jgi:hypothetical protein